MNESNQMKWDQFKSINHKSKETINPTPTTNPTILKSSNPYQNKKTWKTTLPCLIYHLKELI